MTKKVPATDRNTYVMVRGLSPEVKRALRVQAAQADMSLEEYLRGVLEQAAAGKGEK